jgi:hypothetical protein
MTKKMTPNTGMINIEELGDPNAFSLFSTSLRISRFFFF